jgi:hypothetical protein
MRRLTATGARRHRTTAERGAGATIVAVLFAGMAFMGLLAVSVDLGNLTYERRQVQNAADATSLALAQECTGSGAVKTTCVPATVDDLLDANAHDAAHRYDTRNDAPDGACARGTATQVGPLSSHPCSSDGAITDLRECPPLPEWLTTGEGANIPYVETYAATETTDGGTKLFLPFSRVLAGGASGDAGTTACARAAWGVPRGYTASLPVTINDCEWRDQTNGGTDYVDEAPSGAKPGYGGAGQPAWPAGSKEIVIVLHDPKKTDSKCTWNGKDFPGGFGWLGTVTKTCNATVSDEQHWVQVDPGASASCGNVELGNLVGTVVEVPVFDCVKGSKTNPGATVPAPSECNPTNPQAGGNNVWYHIAGWAKFYVSGMDVPGVTKWGLVPGGHTSCGISGAKCIAGWFLTGELSATPSSVGAPGGPDDFGTYVIKPAG